MAIMQAQAMNCLVQALDALIALSVGFTGSLIGLYQHSQGIGDWLVSLLIVPG